VYVCAVVVGDRVVVFFAVVGVETTGVEVVVEVFLAASTRMRPGQKEQ
jgi:hypothetical protein